jgi:hypothetical protein
VSAYARFRLQNPDWSQVLKFSRLTATFGRAVLARNDFAEAEGVLTGWRENGTYCEQDENKAKPSPGGVETGGHVALLCCVMLLLSSYLDSSIQCPP